MRAAVCWLLALIFATVLVGGCVDAGDPAGDPAQQPDEGDEGDEGDPDDVDADDPEPQDCEERARPRAYPSEQRVADRSEIRCPGHYAVTDEGSGAKTQVPEWSPGDWWHWQVEHLTGCFQARWEVAGETLEHNTSLWIVQVQPMDCDGEDAGSPRNWTFTKDSLSRMFGGSRDGFIRHEYVFPLSDGMRWSFMDWPKGNLVDVNATYIEDHTFGGEELETWRVDREGTNLQGDDWMEQSWFSPEAGNLLRKEFTMNGIVQESWQLIDSVNGYGEEDVLPLPVVLK